MFWNKPMMWLVAEPHFCGVNSAFALQLVTTCSEQAMPGCPSVISDVSVLPRNLGQKSFAQDSAGGVHQSSQIVLDPYIRAVLLSH